MLVSFGIYYPVPGMWNTVKVQEKVHLPFHLTQAPSHPIVPHLAPSHLTAPCPIPPIPLYPILAASAGDGFQNQVCLIKKHELGHHKYWNFGFLILSILSLFSLL